MSDFRSVISEDSDAYYHRNGGRIERPRDPVLEAIRMIHRSRPIARLLEVGCSTGWRLEDVRRETGAVTVGLEASGVAVRRGREEYPEVQLFHGVAPEDLPHLRHEAGPVPFDCVVLGFVEYLIPRQELFFLAAEIDRLVAENGHIIVFDFLHPRSVQVDYVHDPRLATFKFDPTSPWSWSPTYTLIHRELVLEGGDTDQFQVPDRWMTVDVLAKVSDSDAYGAQRAVP